MDAEKLLQSVGDDLEQAETELRRAEARVRAAAGRVEELRSAQRVLKSLIERFEQKPAADRTVDLVGSNGSKFEVKSSTGPESSEWQHLPIMDAARRALVELGRPANGKEVHGYLIKVGRGEDYQQVRSALAYAGRRNKIQRVGRGLWEARSDPLNAEDPVTAGSSGDASTTASGGDVDVETPDHDHRDDQRERFGDRDYRPSVVGR